VLGYVFFCVDVFFVFFFFWLKLFFFFVFFFFFFFLFVFFFRWAYQGPVGVGLELGCAALPVGAPPDRRSVGRH